MSWFVRPDTTVLHVQGQTLTVKRRLNAGERDEYYARMYVADVNGQYQVNPIEVRRALVTTYLLDWSLQDDAGQPVVIRGASLAALTAKLKALDPERFADIYNAIQQHETAMTAEREQEKNAQDGGTESPAISPSPSAPAGALSGSVN